VRRLTLVVRLNVQNDGVFRLCQRLLDRTHPDPPWYGGEELCTEEDIEAALSEQLVRPVVAAMSVIGQLISANGLQSSLKRHQSHHVDCRTDTELR
jgi:hypothetical protein